MTTKVHSSRLTVSGPACDTCQSSDKTDAAVDAFWRRLCTDVVQELINERLEQIRS